MQVRRELTLVARGKVNCHDWFRVSRAPRVLLIHVLSLPPKTEHPLYVGLEKRGSWVVQVRDDVIVGRSDGEQSPSDSM